MFAVNGSNAKVDSELAGSWATVFNKSNNVAKRKQSSTKTHLKAKSALHTRQERLSGSLNLRAAENFIATTTGFTEQAKCERTKRPMRSFRTRNRKEDHDTALLSVATSGTQKNRQITEYFPATRRSGRRSAKEIQDEQLKELESLVDAYATREPAYFKVVNFDEKGRGVVAVCAFQRGDFVVEYAGDLVDDNEACRREALYAKDSSVGCYVYHFAADSRRWCIDATRETDRIGRLINHSRRFANLQTRCVVLDVPRLLFFAKRDIAVGEELLYDYGDRSQLALNSNPWLKS